MYQVKDGKLWFDETLIGEATELFVDSRQDAESRRVTRTVEGVRVVRLPVGDYVFVTREGKIAVGEEKRYQDFVSSVSTHRLQRQLRQGIAAADIVFLAVRTNSGYKLFDPAAEAFLHDVVETHHAAWLYWQMLGVYIVFMPYGAEETIVRLKALRSMLVPSRSVLSAIAGTDKQRPDTGTPVARALQRMFTGVGESTATKLATYFKQDLVAVLRASDEELVRAGAHKGIIRRVREVVP